MLWLREACCLKFITKPHLFIALFQLAGCDAGQAPTKGNVQNVVPSGPASMTPLQRAEAGKVLWEEKCRTVAGERIYKTVPDVEGLVLLKLRPEAGSREWADTMWPGAAFARENMADGYINTFLGYEEAFAFGGIPRPITKAYRGYINTSYKAGPKQYPGYRYVDVIDEKDGQRYRYTLAYKSRPNSKIGWIDTVLEKSPTSDPAPRYGVTYEDHVIPEERALGVASSTVKVIDLETGEVLGEMLRYAWSTPASRANPSPWLTAHRCPDHAVGTDAATRKFVDQVIIPRKEN